MKTFILICIIIGITVSTVYLFCENTDLHQKNKEYIGRLEKIVPSGNETITVKFSMESLGNPNDDLFGKYLLVHHPCNNITYQIENLKTLEVLES